MNTQTNPRTGIPQWRIAGAVGFVIVVGAGVWLRTRAGGAPAPESHPVQTVAEGPSVAPPSAPSAGPDPTEDLLPNPTPLVADESKVPPQLLAEIRRFSDGYARAACDGMDKCCGANNVAFDGATCVTKTAKLEREMAVASVGTGDGLSFDSTAAADCIAHRRAETLSCGEMSPEDMERTALACERVFSKKLPEGAKCAARSDCALVAGKRIYCESGSGSETQVCVAVTPPRRGDGCEAGAGFAHAPCGEPEDHLRCDEVTHTCQPLLSKGAMCTQTGECGGDTFCALPVGASDGAEASDGGQAAPGHCEALRPAGGACHGAGDPGCSAATYCDGDHCVARKAPGTACADPDECTSRVCGPAGTCMANVLGTRQSCGAGDDI
jgi:hypothetical protein